jgi:hypothetical protein
VFLFDVEPVVGSAFVFDLDVDVAVAVAEPDEPLEDVALGCFA